MFDVKVGDFFLLRKDIEDIAEKLDINIVPIIHKGTLMEMSKLVEDGFNSQWGNFIAEGLIAKPSCELFDRNGKRILTKLKHKDFLKL